MLEAPWNNINKAKRELFFNHFGIWLVSSFPDLGYLWEVLKNIPESFYELIETDSSFVTYSWVVF